MAGVHPRDPGALERILASCGESIFRFLRLMIHDAEAARDLTQETFIRLYESGGRFETEGSLKSWLYRTAQRIAIDHLRRRKALRARLVRLGEPAHSADPRERAEVEQLRDEVRAAVAELPEGCRSTLILAEIEGMPYLEIARIEGGSDMAARQRAAYARKLLRDKLADRIDSERKEGKKK